MECVKRSQFDLRRHGQSLPDNSAISPAVDLPVTVHSSDIDRHQQS